jgi:hypothetical protein
MCAPDAPDQKERSLPRGECLQASYGEFGARSFILAFTVGAFAACLQPGKVCTNLPLFSSGGKEKRKGDRRQIAAKNFWEPQITQIKPIKKTHKLTHRPGALTTWWARRKQTDS